MRHNSWTITLKITGESTDEEARVKIYNDMRALQGFAEEVLNRDETKITLEWERMSPYNAEFQELNEVLAQADNLQETYVGPNLLNLNEE